MKKIISKIPRNPLKRLISDEEIQGNPIGPDGGFDAETASRQEKPNRTQKDTGGGSTESVGEARRLKPARSFPP
ncbi:MAG: hypothetical protein WAN05_05100 [Roseiarcus sp.]